MIFLWSHKRAFSQSLELDLLMEGHITKHIMQFQLSIAVEFGSWNPSQIEVIYQWPIQYNSLFVNQNSQAK
jgi:hypothetical protein